MRCVQGELVGLNIEKPTRKYMGTQATSAVQLYDLSLAASGMTQTYANNHGLDIRSTELLEDYRPAFMLSTAPVSCMLTWDPQTRLVKGAQFCSTTDEVASTANVVSVAIQAKFTIDMLANVDFLFQPNFDQPSSTMSARSPQRPPPSSADSCMPSCWGGSPPAWTFPPQQELLQGRHPKRRPPLPLLLPLPLPSSSSSPFPYGM